MLFTRISFKRTRSGNKQLYLYIYIIKPDIYFTFCRENRVFWYKIKNNEKIFKKALDKRFEKCYDNAIEIPF